MWADLAPPADSARGRCTVTSGAWQRWVVTATCWSCPPATVSRWVSPVLWWFHRLYNRWVNCTLGHCDVTVLHKNRIWREWIEMSSPAFYSHRWKRLSTRRSKSWSNSTSWGTVQVLGIPKGWWTTLGPEPKPMRVFWWKKTKQSLPYLSCSNCFYVCCSCFSLCRRRN